MRFLSEHGSTSGLRRNGGALSRRIVWNQKLYQRGVLIVSFVLEIEFNSDPLSDQDFPVGDELARTLEGRRGGFDFHN